MQRVLTVFKIQTLSSPDECSEVYIHFNHKSCSKLHHPIYANCSTYALQDSKVVTKRCHASGICGPWDISSHSKLCAMSHIIQSLQQELTTFKKVQRSSQGRNHCAVCEMYRSNKKICNTSQRKKVLTPFKVQTFCQKDVNRMRSMRSSPFYTSYHPMNAKYLQAIRTKTLSMRPKCDRKIHPITKKYRVIDTYRLYGLTTVVRRMWPECGP